MTKSPRKFEEIAQDDRGSLVTEFLAFLRYNKKWWLLPMLVVILLLGGLVLLGGTGLAPFIYTLF